MTRFLIGWIKAYRLLLSPWLGSSCRFTPTCSAYGLQALARHGAASGSYLTLKRIARCHPWCQGGHDPVPFTAFCSTPTVLSSQRQSSSSSESPLP
ncbi:MAG: membrane protein insertion efficiency factor YidD [Burkholderiales bacterium]|nr:membrane protein insertion efficiency factor YidD [Burkholderiales bacterium]